MLRHYTDFVRYFFRFNTCMLVFFIISLLTGATSSSMAQSQDILFERPVAGETTISKKPEIKCVISSSYLRETLLVIVDQTDMTDLANFTENGFSLTPFQAIPSGKHTVSVRFLDENNQVHEGQSEFTTRHSTLFETATSDNTLSAIYTHAVGKSGVAESGSVSDWQIEGNLESSNTLGKGIWKVGLQTNARYTDQEHDVADPLKNGLYLADYLLTGEVDTGSAKVDAGVGDVSVEGTDNTISSLYRRGMTLGADTHGIFVRGFSLKSRDVFGEAGSEDLSLQKKDHLLGVISGAGFFDDNLNIKAIYASGGEDAGTETYNTWPQSVATRGNVFGFEVKTNLIDNKLVTRLETDWSDFDADTNDAQASISDKAYLGQASGTIDFFNYDLLYEYTGADYRVATSSVQSDRKGVTTSAGFNFISQSFLISFGRYNDNLNRDPTKPRLNSTQFGTTYSFNRFPSLPISIGWQRSLQDSSLEPVGTTGLENTTDSYTGSVSFIKDAFILGFQPAYARMDDETDTDYDSQTQTLALYSGYNNERFSIFPSLAYNRYEALNLDTEQDTLSFNLSFAVELLNGLELDGSAAYSTMDSSDDAIDQRNFSTDLQLSYAWQKPIGQIFSPSIQLRLTQNNAHDGVADTDINETTVYMVFTGVLDLSY